jgi:acyl carrier protein
MIEHSRQRVISEVRSKISDHESPLRTQLDSLSILELIGVIEEELCRILNQSELNVLVETTFAKLDHHLAEL